MTVVLPHLDEGNRTFWEGCRAGELRLQRCNSCDHLRYPISPVCPRCLGTDAMWEAVSGDGRVWSFGIFRHAYNNGWRERVPYNVALVRLDAGPALISNVVGIAPEELRVDLPVTVAFEAVTDEVTLPVFKPRDEDGAR
jgi:uncharacterized OB-fold protein